MIGIFGGTFDPIHFGHLRPALECLQGLGLEQVRFIPLNVAVHRLQPVGTPQMRLAMLEAAIAGQPGLVADPRELCRSGGSYSFDTLVSLREELGESVSICLIIGGDAFAGFLGWYRPLEILELAHLVVMRRPGHAVVTDGELRRLCEERGCDGARQRMAEVPGGRILFHDVTQIEISSTQIRGLIARGVSPSYLLPDPAIHLIDEWGLYR